MASEPQNLQEDCLAPWIHPRMRLCLKCRRWHDFPKCTEHLLYNIALLERNLPSDGQCGMLAPETPLTAEPGYSDNAHGIKHLALNRNGRAGPPSSKTCAALDAPERGHHTSGRKTVQSSHCGPVVGPQKPSEWGSRSVPMNLPQ